DPLGDESARATCRVVLTQLEEVLGFAGEAKLPAGAGPPDERGPVTPRELVDQPLGPQMLVNVHAVHAGTIAIKLIHLVWKGTLVRSSGYAGNWDTRQATPSLANAACRGALLRQPGSFEGRR